MVSRKATQYSFASVRRQRQPRRDGCGSLIGPPGAADCASHLAETRFESFIRYLQFQRRGFINASLIKRFTVHFVRHRGYLEHLAKQDAFSSVCSYVSASDLSQISSPCSDYTDGAHLITFALRIADEPRQSRGCNGLDSPC